MKRRTNSEKTYDEWQEYDKQQKQIWNRLKNYFYKIKRRWSDESKQLRVKEIDRMEFIIRADVFDGAGIKGNIEIKVAKSYIGENDILKYIESDANYVRILYYEKKK